MLERRKVLVTGASELPDDLSDLAGELGRQLMTGTHFSLVTGGLESKPGKAVAADFVIADAARRALGTHELEGVRIVTMRPEVDVPGFTRFAYGRVETVRGSQLQSRRFAMVLSCDAVVSIGGSNATGEILDLAHVAGKPMVPIPASGGASAEWWHRHEADILERVQAEDSEALVARLHDASDPAGVAGACYSLLQRALRPVCFVAMPFSGHPEPHAWVTIEAVAKDAGYQAVRLDKETFRGSIIDAIWESIRSAAVVIADLTDHRPNVFYELGISHALDKPTVLTVHSRDGKVPADIPFDVKVQRILVYRDTDDLRRQLDEHLAGI